VLIIRREQFLALERARRASLSQQIRNHLRQLDKARGSLWSEEELDKQTLRAVEHGLRFFRREEDILRYCDAVVKRLGGWEEQEHPPDAVSMLRARSIAPAKRIENFDRWASRRLGAPRAR
jgi:hypothetical protein